MLIINFSKSFLSFRSLEAIPTKYDNDFPATKRAFIKGSSLETFWEMN